MLRLPMSRGRGDQEVFAAFWEPFEAEMRAGCATRQFSTGGDYRRLIYRFLTGAARGISGFLAGCGAGIFSGCGTADCFIVEEVGHDVFGAKEQDHQPQQDGKDFDPQPAGANSILQIFGLTNDCQVI
jgi:hypothetical protein